MVRFKDALFFTGLFIYGLFSSPTPDRLGWAEITAGLCLILSISVNLRTMPAQRYAFLVYGFSVPLLVGCISGHAIISVIRDFIPFCFLLLPIFFEKSDGINHKTLSRGIVFIGLIFSLRSLWASGEQILFPQEWLGAPPDLLYLANSPEVIFACLFLFGMALCDEGKSIRMRLAVFTLGLIPLLAMATLMQRAGLFYVGLCTAIYIGISIWKFPKRIFYYILSCVFLYFTVNHFIEQILQGLSMKTQIVGLNSRGAEWSAVVDHVTNSSIQFLFGNGWGAGFENPAVGGLRVNFTHSLLSSLLLKTGLIGLLMFLLYFFDLLKGVMSKLGTHYVLVLALAGPLFIGLTLYASYKSLGFGLLLLLLSRLGKGKELEQF